jgi:hypothetical protein
MECVTRVSTGTSISGPSRAAVWRLASVDNKANNFA